MERTGPGCQVGVAEATETHGEEAWQELGYRQGGGQGEEATGTTEVRVRAVLGEGQVRMGTGLEIGMQVRPESSGNVALVSWCLLTAVT